MKNLNLQIPPKTNLNNIITKSISVTIRLTKNINSTGKKKFNTKLLEDIAFAEKYYPIYVIFLLIIFIGVGMIIRHFLDNNN
jgi:hypothetical protein